MYSPPSHRFIDNVKFSFRTKQNNARVVWSLVVSKSNRYPPLRTKCDIFLTFWVFFGLNLTRRFGSLQNLEWHMALSKLDGVPRPDISVRYMDMYTHRLRLRIENASMSPPLLPSPPLPLRTAPLFLPRRSLLDHFSFQLFIFQIK